jgi:hypothetical protein
MLHEEVNALLHVLIETSMGLGYLQKKNKNQ